MPRIRPALDIPETAVVAMEIKWYPTTTAQVSFRGAGWGAAQPKHVEFDREPDESTAKDNIMDSGAVLYAPTANSETTSVWEEDFNTSVVNLNGATWTIGREKVTGTGDFVLDPRDSTAKQSGATVTYDIVMDGDEMKIQYVVIMTEDAKPREAPAANAMERIERDSKRGGRSLGTVAYVENGSTHTAQCLAHGMLAVEGDIVEMTQWLTQMRLDKPAEADDGGTPSVTKKSSDPWGALGGAGGVDNGGSPGGDGGSGSWDVAPSGSNDNNDNSVEDEVVGPPPSVGTKGGGGWG